MQRRGESEQPVKGQSANRPEARNAPTAQVSTSDPQEQLDRVIHERDEALEQLAATSEILRVIRTSPTDVQPVFETIVRNAVSLCGSLFANVFRFDGELLHWVASNNVGPSFVDLLRAKFPMRPDSSQVAGRVLLTKSIIRVEDALEDPDYDKRFPRAMGWRRLLGVPMLREGDPLGVIVVGWAEAGPVPKIQEQLLKTFADQAVIAIDNVRLFEAEQARTRELSESLEQQTATSEVLKVISSSPGELEPVFNTILANATRICEATFGNLFLLEGHILRAVAVHSKEIYADQWRRDPEIDLREHPKIPSARVLTTKQVVHIPDLRTDVSYLEKDSRVVGVVEVAGARTFLSVPMLKEGEIIGTIAMYRQEVRPFTDKQIELVQNFAAQAVIAIENTRLLNELRTRTDDLSEALEQQTATSEVLQVISSSPGELTPVFEAMLANAVRICEAKFGTMFLREGDAFRTVALHNAPPAYVELRTRNPVIHPHPSTALSRLVATRQVVHIPDILVDQGYLAGAPSSVAIFETAGARTLLVVPMLKDNEVVGAILIYRQEVRPFADKQIELVKNFAAQAVIAIENTRLLNELRESLQQQTATADVLKVISTSPGDLGPVFDTMLANAVHVCGANFGIMHRYDGGAFCNVAMHNVPPAFAEMRRSNPVIRPSPGTGLGRVERTKKVVQILDLKSEQTYRDRVPATVAMVELAGARTLLVVPMVKDDVLLGTIAIYRQEVRPFSDKQIELVENFSAQAVIAIENTRLLNELRESLQQQTATADVLKVISRSTFDLQAVLDTLVESAARLCQAYDSVIFLRHGEGLRVRAHYGPIPMDFAEFPIGRAWVNGRAFVDRAPVHVHDLQASTSEFPDGAEMALRLGHRTILAVPLLREDEAIGALSIRRTEVKVFTEKQIELLTTFADQAVIAIENVRLFDEVQARTRELSESLEQQTATSEVLQVISSSPGELAPVFEAILGNATRICEAKFGTLTQVVDGIPRLMFQLGVPAPLEEYWRRETPRPSPHNAISRVITTGQAVHVTDLQAYQAYIDGDPLAVAGVELGGIRTLLVVPMLKDDKTFGTIGIYRQEVHPFTDKQIELVSNFAAQAAIAIENTRLLNELRQRTDDLSKSLEDLRTAQDRLVQTQKLASLGQLTAGIAHEIKNPLNFVNNFSGVSAELIDELQEALKDVSLNEKRRSEISELMDTLRGNLDKVMQHGKRADAIVKNMLLHSREGSGEHRLVDINALVEEGLNLAYHGARAEKQGFNITLERSFDATAGEADVFPQDITRVLLNLISNGFYAATKRRAETNGGDYEPTLAAATKNLGDRIEIRIRDNGTGIPLEVKEKMFNPFFTTKPAGEGTGLGLSISHDIIVKQHGGSIEVDTQPGEFTEVRIILPRAAVFLAESGGRA